ncbi:MAG TPA: YIP1 family protein [Chryseobacterium sp.]
MNWKTIFNPFEKFDEKILLVIGIIFFILTIPLCYFTESCFISIYRIAPFKATHLYDLIIPTFISFAAMIAVLFLLGKIFYRKTRIIDIANAVLISQIPLIILIPFEKFDFIKQSIETVTNYQSHPTEIFPFVDFSVMILFTIANIGCLIYSVAIFYNGFKTATNIKKWQQTVIFCIVTFLTVMICQILNN